MRIQRWRGQGSEIVTDLAVSPVWAYTVFHVLPAEDGSS